MNVSFFSAEGMFIGKYNFKKGEPIDIENLKPGLIIYEIESEGEELKSGKIIKIN